MYGQQLADIYDTVYIQARGKDYAAEARDLTALIRARKPDATSLLDVACGTGEHLAHLRGLFAHVEGVELAQPMRAIAVEKLPDVTVHSGDMRTLALPGRFDAVTCLFSAIGYVDGIEELNAAIARMAAHLHPGGVLVVEPWFTPEQWRDGMVSHTVSEVGERTVIRMSHSTQDGRISIMTMHYLVGEPGEVRHFTDEHRLTLFTDEEYEQAFEAAGLTSVTRVPGWAKGRDRIVAVR